MTPEFPVGVAWLTLEYIFVSSTDGPTYREATTREQNVAFHLRRAIPSRVLSDKSHS